MKISEVLKKAKPFLKKSEYVCYAIEDCGAPSYDEIRTKNYIRDLIHPWTTVDDWLFNKGIFKKDLTNENMLEYRERWIDHMIHELERDGK